MIASKNISDIPNSLSKGEKCNRRIVFALCCILFIPAINYFLNTFLKNGLSIAIEFLTPTSYIFMAFISVFFLYKNIYRKKIFLGIFMFYLLGVIISYLIYPEIRDVIYSSPVDLVYSPVNKLFFFCIPSLIGVACLTDYNAFFDGMRLSGRITVIMGVITYCFVFFYVGINLQYMVYSYYMLLPICVCYEYARVKKSRIDFLIAVSGTICIIMCGARGAAISLMMYFLVGLLFSGFERLSIKKVIQLLFGVIIAVVVLLFYEEMLLAIVGLFDRFGIESRFITSLYEGVLFEDSGRLSITDAVIEGLKNNPIGYGLYGDRYVSGKFGSGRYSYAHNIITELFCDFGIIGGSIAIFLIIWRIWKMLYILRNRQEISLILALLPYGLFQLFFSSSFLENVPFFIIIGMSFLVNWRKYLISRL